MAVKRVSVVVPSTDLPGSVSFWSTLLGTSPTFVDGERWAQFDVGGARLSVGAGAERPESVSVMLSVDDLDGFCAAALAADIAVGPVTVGPHERRINFVGPGGERIVAFESLT